MFIANPTVVKALLASAALLSGAVLFTCLLPYLTAAWRKASGLGRCLFVFGSIALALYGGAKNGGTNDVQRGGEVGGPGEVKVIGEGEQRNLATCAPAALSVEAAACVDAASLPRIVDAASRRVG